MQKKTKRERLARKIMRLEAVIKELRKKWNQMDVETGDEINET